MSKKPFLVLDFNIQYIFCCSAYRNLSPNYKTTWNKINDEINNLRNRRLEKSGNKQEQKGQKRQIGLREQW